MALCGCPDRTTALPKQLISRRKWLSVLPTNCSADRETLLRSTVHGTKEFAPLDQVVIAAIKGKFRLKQCTNLIDCFHDLIKQYVLGGSLHKNNTIYLLLGLYHASVN